MRYLRWQIALQQRDRITRDHIGDGALEAVRVREIQPERAGIAAVEDNGAGEIAVELEDRVLVDLHGPAAGHIGMDLEQPVLGKQHTSVGQRAVDEAAVNRIADLDEAMPGDQGARIDGQRIGGQPVVAADFSTAARTDG